ncbi:hypothetical protein N665_0201s0291 [Sinapis alba]|nr:hypothetical protein N665_0201s0291 [Sinapis alba]
MGGGDVSKEMGTCSLAYRRGDHKLRKFVTARSIKFLLLAIIAFALITLACRSSRPWFNTSIAVADQISRSRKGYTLLINTWKRYDLLKKSVSHYASCSRLDSIHIVWSEPNPPSESLKEYLEKIVKKKKGRDGHEVELRFDVNKEDSLNNRFKEIQDLKTDAVFSIDDDIIFPCHTVDFAFNVWESAPETMVGFVPRVHWPEQSNGKADYYTYSGWWSVWWSGTYSMVLSKAAFFHKKYLSLYTNDMPASIREFTTKNRNCEDIAMSFLIANATNAPPIWVKGKIYEIGSTGISSIGGHTEKRTHCVNRFVAEFGRMPLVYTSMKAVDSRSLWFW